MFTGKSKPFKIKMMIKSYFASIFLTLILGIFFGAINYLATKEIVLYNSIEEIYFFNFVLTLVSLFILFVINLKFNDKVGYAFLAVGIIKMAVSVVYLLPLVDSDFSNKIPDTLSFFSAYFIFLIIESIVVVRILNKKN